MSSFTDIHKTILFNDGEEITDTDLNGLQRIGLVRTVEQLLQMGGPKFDSLDPDMPGSPGQSTLSLAGNLATGPYAYALSAGAAYFQQGSAFNILAITPGTVLQKVASTDGSASTLIPFTFTSTTEIATIANGDLSNPRVDIVQMKLEYVDDTLTTIVTALAPLKAELDFSTVTAHVNTVVRAKAAGLGGDNISISLTHRSSGTGVTYSEAGNTISILYQGGLSTVSDLETAITTNSTLIEIASAGTPSNILTSGTDDVPSTHLAGGLDSVVTPVSSNKAHRVKCTITVKQGTPAASPRYPVPDAGFVLLAGVVVGTNYVAAGPFISKDTAGAVAVLHDQRMPMRIRAYGVGATDYIFTDEGDIVLTNRMYANRVATTGSREVIIPLNCGPAHGRLVKVATVVLGNGITSRLTRYNQVDNTTLDLNDAQLSGNSGIRQFIQTAPFQFQDHHTPVAGPTVLLSTTQGIGPPIWTSGCRAPMEITNTNSPGGTNSAIGQWNLSTEFNVLALRYLNPSSYQSTGTWFWIAEGW